MGTRPVSHDLRTLWPRKLWIRLTVAFALVTLVVMGITIALGLIGLSQGFDRYITDRFGTVPESIGRQLAAYYRLQGSWDGVEVLIEDDFPLSLFGLVLVDDRGTAAYSSVEASPVPSTEAMRPITVDGQTVGYWTVGMPDRALRGPPEHAFLGGLRRLFLLGVLLATATGLAASAVLVHSLTTPLQRLVNASHAVAAGDLHHRVQESGSDELVEVARSFNEMTAALERAEELRQNMLSDVAHELRTPLSVLQGNLRAILDDVYPLEKSEIARLYDETRLLNRLVEDLRQLALAEAGELSLNPRATDLGDLLRDTAAMFEPAAEAKEIELTLDIADDLPVIEADPDRLAQVQRNLLTNALRHTPAGGRIVVTARCAKDAIRVAVQDSGKGIAPEDLGRVFERFWRADRSRSRDSGGSGLGLAIARSLVRAHEGRIWAESELGQGATFIYELPMSLDRPRT
jgi:two-component system OmpR family sensor kinase/two-component system sensor histidine kinase BaeS